MIRSDLIPIPDALRDEWRVAGNLRIHDFFDQDFALSVLAALREVPHPLCEIKVPGLKFQYGVHENFPDQDCEHTLCILTRYWFTEGLRWVSNLTGQDLTPPPRGSLVSTHYSKGCYLDPHSDIDGSRHITYILGFTPETWPAEHGGYLEFLHSDGGSVHVVDRRPPGFNTLDLFDVQRDNMTHHVPLLQKYHERRVVAGWFHRDPLSATQVSVHGVSM